MPGLFDAAISFSMNQTLARRLPFRLVQRLTSEVDVTVGSRVVRVPVWDSAALGWIYRSNGWKPELFAKLLRVREGAFIDVGANIGQSLADFLATDLRRRYIGFEPNTRCVAFVSDLIRRSALTDTDVLPLGLWKEVGVQSLFFDPDRASDQTGSLRQELRPTLTRASQWVTTMRFDDLIAPLALDRVAVIKIDVEGAELEALLGMKSLLAAQSPSILCEVLLPDAATDLSLYRKRTQDLYGLLQQHEYQVYRCEVRDGKFAGISKLQEFPVTPWTPKAVDACDYLFSPAWLDVGKTFGVIR
jgi:FkbM family methyltransferase